MNKKICPNCGREFEDTSPNHSMIFCDQTCRGLYEGSNVNRNYFVERESYNWRIPNICKTCKYRIPINSGIKIVSEVSWVNTMCGHLYITNEVRGCTPTDEHCDKYISRYNNEP